MILTTFLLIYVLSVRGTYKFIQNAHYHEIGRWNSLETDPSDLIILFLPVLNTIPAIQYLLGGWKRKQYKKSSFDFFKPKKDLK